MWNPRVAHYASLAVGLVVLLVVARDQWFFGDDWAILAPHLDGAVMQPHVGHWNLIPAVVFQALRNLVGLNSYLPYLLLVFVAHLTVAHLLWRVLGRIGIPAWGATIIALLVVFLGAGAEDILWAFQFGFLGAVAVGLGAILLLDRPGRGVGTIIGVIVLAAVAPMFSGTAIPLLAAAAMVGWVRSGFWRTIVLFLPAAAGYLAWYVTFALGSESAPQPVHTVAGAAFAVVYAGAMLAGGLGRALPWIGLGAIPAAAVLVWFVATVRRGLRSSALPAYALVCGSLVFVLLTAYARSSFGLSAAAAQRYAYVTIVLLLPALSLIGVRLLRVRARAATITAVALLGLVVFNAGTLETSARSQATREAASERRVDATYEKVTNGTPSAALLATPADPKWAPDLLAGDVRQLARWHQFSPKN